ncbi:hypothetical protein NE237_022566 [Protea cynaroides]|uniref:Uncharacterized protein n=1 Tax=Protea cynaroides TaxID=273540 RepID=A0A9Q0K4L3_9MAGN|nr:hypothetical protein NE237_022566 [Protea cynaroides]
MELRSFSHMHFVQAIKRGTVEKISNVDSCGRPSFRFKTLKAIYESEDAKNIGSCTTFQKQGGGLMHSSLGCGGVKIDRMVLLTDSSKIKTDHEDTCDRIGNSAMDDPSFSEITLKQLKERCKTKKRKLPKFVDLKKEESCFHLNEDHAKLQLKEDESDLEESLSSWKLRLLKKPKAKQKCIRKEVHSPSKSAVSVSEQTPSAPPDSLQSTVDLTGSIKTEIDVSGPEVSDCHNLDDFTFGATLNLHPTVDSRANISDEGAVSSKTSELAIGKSTFLTTESPCCVVTEISIEHLKGENSISLPASAAVEEVMEDSFSEVIGQDTLSSSVSELATSISIIQSIPIASTMEAPSVTNKPGSETCGSCESYSFMQGTSYEVDSSSVIHMPHKLNDDSFRCTKPNDVGGYILNVESEDNSKEDTFPDPATNAIRNSDILYMSFQKMNSDFNFPSDFSSINCSPPIIEEKQKHSSLSIEGPVSAGTDTESDGDIKEDNLSDPKTSGVNNTDILYISSQNCHTCLNPPSSSEDFNSAIDEKQSFSTEEGPMANIAGVRDCSVWTDRSDDTESRTNMEVLEKFHALKLQSPPKRLLSTRKAISPTSQEKLRQAVEVDYLNDPIGLSKCRERLCFGKQSKTRASSTESDLKGVEVKVSPQRFILKLKNEKSRPNLLVPKGILKSPNVSCAMPQAATESTCAHPSAESAIAFSQRQMRDIECLAMKLVQELKFMKDIVVEKMHPEVDSSKSSKYTVDEMGVAVDKAGEIEETTRKWLSMMARDCSRFCRIMRSTGKKAVSAPTSNYGLHKDRKRIVFADEAGGPLCHVKVFEDQLASLCGSECENEKDLAN